jgi:hypothetical protein
VSVKAFVGTFGFVFGGLYGIGGCDVMVLIGVCRV